MSSDLGGVTNRSIRDCLGTRCFTSGALAIDGTNTENVETTVAVVHCVEGVFQTDLATDAEIDLSAKSVLNAKDGAVGAAGSGKTFAARAAGDADETLIFVLACLGDQVFIVEPDVDVAAAQDDANYELNCPAGYAPFGVIKLVRTDADTATFQLGNNTSAQGDLDQTGRTATFFNISVLPPTVADLVEA
jgi:hypothetical protein